MEPSETQKRSHYPSFEDKVRLFVIWFFYVFIVGGGVVYHFLWSR